MPRLGMKLKNLQGEWRLPLLVLVLLVGLRWHGGLLAGKGIIFNDDEMLMTLSAIDRFLGIPPRLSWPGTPLHLFALPALLARFIFQGQAHLSIDKFAIYISELYRSPWVAVMINRFTVIFLSSIGFVLLIASLRDVSQNVYLRIASILLIATTPLVWMYSYMVMSDGLALSFSMIALFFLGKSQARITSGNLLGGLLYGFALASKVTIIIAFPLMLALLLMHSSSKIRDSFVFVLSTTAGFVFACPYIWTDPIRLAKGILGNASRSGDAAGLFGAVEMMIEVFTFPLLLLSAVGFCCFLAQKKLYLAAGSLLTIGLALVIFARAGVVYDRYYLVLVLPLSYCLAAGLQSIWILTGRFCGNKQRAKFGLQAFSLLAVSSFLIGSNISTYWQNLQSHQERGSAVWAMVNQIGTMQCKGPIAVPREALSLVSSHASSLSLVRIAEGIKPLNPMETVGRFAQGRGISETSLSVFGEAFNEEEKAFVSRIRAMAVSSPAGPQYDVIAWATDEEAARFQIANEGKVEALLLSGQLCAAIVHGRSPALMAYPGTSYGDFKLIQ
jgi:hypothetical protein